jgi:hypothetical protein
VSLEHAAPPVRADKAPSAARHTSDESATTGTTYGAGATSAVSRVRRLPADSRCHRVILEVIHRVHGDDRHDVATSVAQDDCGLHIRTDGQVPVYKDVDAAACDNGWIGKRHWESIAPHGGVHPAAVKTRHRLRARSERRSIHPDSGLQERIDGPASEQPGPHLQ